jgi:hypothetical protein
MRLTAMPTELITILPILRLEPTRRRKNLGRLLIRQAQSVERIPEEILVAVSEETIHIRVGDHVIGEVKDGEVEAVVAAFVKDDLS